MMTRADKQRQISIRWGKGKLTFAEYHNLLLPLYDKG